MSTKQLDELKFWLKRLDLILEEIERRKGKVSVESKLLKRVMLDKVYKGNNMFVQINIYGGRIKSQVFASEENDIAGMLASIRFKKGTNEQYIHISHFTNSWSKHQETEEIQGLTEEEFKLGRGLGKILLCETFKFALEQKIFTKDRIVELEASGGICIDPKPKLTESEVENILSRYPNLLENTAFYTSEKKYEIACRILDNLKLVEYYRKTYGFEIVNPKNFDPFAVLMRSNVATILNHC